MSSPLASPAPRVAGRPLQTTCPNCTTPGLEPFYEARGIPAHSVMLMHTREEAINYPKGDLSLGFCRACGFITNMLFDVSMNEYSSNFEETQHFSAKFDAWARGLVDRLVDDYDIRGKRVIEIGCGKGEWLELLCEAGGNYGVGIDPGCHPGRLKNEGDGPGQVKLIQDLYSEKYADIPADVVACRHTLEHIQPTREFMQMVRRVIGDRPDTLVFLEVPDMTRVLRERAFWDVYYEHCTYLTAGSLARLFRSTGFEILELVRDFGDQYIWITARPSTGSSSTLLPLEDDLAATTADMAFFREHCPQEIAELRDRIRGLAAAGKKPVLWGAGSKAVGFLTTTGIGTEVGCLVDINPYKAGKFLPGTGHVIIAPEDLKQRQPGAVIAMNPVYVDEIRARLRTLGIAADVTAV
jgi:ubiquinone/menaquinone biosynthesis C-methylase UbiE